MAVPKRKVSKCKGRSRRAAHDLTRPKISVQKCAQCGADSQPHRVCAACGYYKGKQVLTIDAD